MNALFDDQPALDRRISSILSSMLASLPNNKPKPQSPCYLKAASWVSKIYGGTFLTSASFDEGRPGDFDFNGVYKAVREAAGSWNAVRSLVLSSLSHLEEAKKPERMPFNKKWVSGISFASFFVSGWSPDGKADSPFLKFVNETPLAVDRNSEALAMKIKRSVIPLLKADAESIGKRWKSPSESLLFWKQIENWSGWASLMSKAFPSVWGDFIVSCDKGRPLVDFMNWMDRKGKAVTPWTFKNCYKDETVLGGMFWAWLSEGMAGGKFACFKSLPGDLRSYWTKESFETKKSSPKPKATLELDQIVF